MTDFTGIAAGGVASGITQGIDNARATSDLAFQNQQRSRLTKSQGEQDAVDKATAAYMANRLAVQPSPVAQGVTTAPDASVKPVASVAPPNAQPSAQPSGPAGGVSIGATQSKPAGQPAAQPGQPAQPQYRNPTIADMTAAAQYRAGLYMQQGNFDKASEATDHYLKFAATQIQQQTAQRALAVKTTVGKIMMGDYSTIPYVYSMIPDGNEIKNISNNSDGSITMNIVDSSTGKPLPAVTFKDQQHLAAAVTALADPQTATKALNDFTEQRIKQETADAAKTKAGAYKTVASADMVRAQALKNATKNGYKINPNQVATALGSPAVDDNGKPIIDPMSGKQDVNRNVAKENAFYKFMSDNHITNADEGLIKFMALPQNVAGAGTPNPTPVPTRPLSDF